MTALDLLTVLCGVLAIGAAVVLSLVSARLLRAVGDLDRATAAFEEEAVPAMVELRDAVQGAVAEVDRIDELVQIAGSIGGRVDTATEATYRALTSPVIKGVAIASGTRRAARRLRGQEHDFGPTNGARR
ncbi:MAG: hypothetical protein V9E94_06520 [Microthrixaceae bacterium]